MAGELSALYLQNPELANALRRRQEAAGLMQGGMDTSPIQSPWQGVSRLAQALVGGYEQGQADKDIKEVGAKRSKLAESLMAPYGGGAIPAQSEAQPAAPVAPVSQAALAPPGGNVPANLSDDDLLVRTAWGESRGETPLGQQAVAAVIRNRARAGGQSIRDVVLAPNQFEPWNNPQTREQMLKLDPNSPEYQTIAQSVLNTQNDPTGGATHFYSPKAQEALGRPAPAWAAGQGTDIGNHRFYNLPYSPPRGGAPQGGTIQVAGPGAPTGQPQRQPGTNDLGEAQFYEQQAMRAQAAGMHQEAQMLMMRAQRAQQAALARQPQPTEIERVALAAGYAPGSSEYQKLMRDYAAKKGAGVNVTVNPNPPADHQAVYDDKGRISHYQVIPGSETARKIAEQQKKEGKREDQTARAGNIIVEDIDRVLKGIDSAVLPAVGVGASTLSGIPGTAAHDVSKLLDGVKANIAFDKLQQMRESSPTGAALGAVSDREMALLQSVVGSLEQSQSATQFKQNLQRLRNLTMDVIHGAGKWKEVAPSDATPTAGPGGDRPPLSSFAR